MRDDKGFDLWSAGYDADVAAMADAEEYPFAGYREVLDSIFSRAMETRPQRVLDVGFGTGRLTVGFYDAGVEVWGIDFSERMIEIAREKMPAAHLLCHDFSRGLPRALAGVQFDAVVSTYAFHHLTDEGKAMLLRELVPHLAPGGHILIGDVAFQTEAARQACAVRSGESWDAAEYYTVFPALQARLPDFAAEFTPCSHCAGVMEFCPKQN